MTIARLNSTDARAARATPATTDGMGGNHDGSMSEATFLYDVGSPWCWLAAERVAHVLGVVPVWQPVLATGLSGGGLETDRAAVDAAAAVQGLPPLRWPQPWPFDSDLAMRAATFAKQAGRAVAFSLA